MDRLDGMQSFVAVVETGSFSLAAARLGIERALVSKRIAALERRLAVRLLNRTTRRVSLTGPGQEFVGRAQRILAEFDGAAATLNDLQVEPSGHLKLTAGVSFGMRQLVPLLDAFTQEHPKVVIDLVLNDRAVDLVEEGFDVALRIGRMVDSSLLARRLAPVNHVLCAAPGYLDRVGRPTVPDDLASLQALHYREAPSQQRWTLSDGQRNVVIEPPCGLSANNGDVLAEAAIAGLGIANLPTFIVGDALRDGRLVTILTGWSLAASALHLVWPGARYMPAKLRVFIDFTVPRFPPRPSWDDGLDVAA